jgi:hypothetical protein
MAAYACRRSDRCFRGRGFDSRRLHNPRKSGVSDRNDSRWPFLVERLQRGLEVGRIQVRVDVRGRANVGVAGEHLRKLQVPGSAKKGRDRRVSRFVHRPMGDVRALDALHPPAVHRRGREWLTAVLPDRPDGPAVELRAQLLRIQQVLFGRRLAVEYVPLECRPEVVVDDGQISHRSALAEDGQVAADRSA